MKKLSALTLIPILIISTINSPILLSSIALSQEQINTTPPPTEPPELKTEAIQTCPAPSQPPVCSENQGLVTNFDDKGCVTGYECKEIPKTEVGQVNVCPELAPPRITCQADEQLSKTTDDKGCVVGYNCVSTAISQVSTQECPAVVPEKPPCDGSVGPVFDKGCLISYSCIPQGCRQETDQSGFVRVECKQERTCPADQEQSEHKSKCYAQGGNPIPFQDPSGCTFYDCRFDNREINPNPIGGHQSCPKGEEIKNAIDQCKATGLVPGVIFEGGCKIVRCTQEIKEEQSCKFVPAPERIRIENECATQGLSAISATDENGCQYFRCGDSPQMTCQRDVPPEAYKKCDARGGEMIVKTNEKGCVVFSQCVAPGDDKQVYVKPVEEVPDTTVLLSLALKLEQLKIELQKLATESNEIAKYYASIDSVDEERYSRVSSMFDSAAERIDEIKTKIRDNAEDMGKDDLEEIKHDIKYIKEVTLKDILYLMLSNSDDVKETLESSKKISTKKLSVDELEENVKSCGTDGFCFDKAIRSCKPVTFQPEGRNGPLVSIVGLRDKNCVLHITMQSSDMIPPGYTKDNFYMDCPIADYAVGVRGPEDIIPTCEGPMAKFAKQFGGAAEISGGDTFQDTIESEGGPGGCTTERECTTYCIDNYDECKQWVKEHPSVGPMPSREELRKYASGEEIERREESREIRKGPSGFSGPGGCTGPQECDKFCRSNPDECIRWCGENPDICPQERGEIPTEVKEEFRQPSLGGQKCPDGICDDFERANPNACPQDCGTVAVGQQLQPKSVQACVGCLNNGICDIGECSECIDCLKGIRSITGEIVRTKGSYE